MRAGCLGLKYCEGSEARTIYNFFLNLRKHGLGRPYRKQCSVRSIVADGMGLFFLEKRNILLGNSQKMFETVVSACTVISRSFPRVVNIVAWPVQR